MQMMLLALRSIREKWHLAASLTSLCAAQPTGFHLVSGVGIYFYRSGLVDADKHIFNQFYLEEEHRKAQRGPHPSDADSQNIVACGDDP